MDSVIGVVGNESVLGRSGMLCEAELSTSRSCVEGKVRVFHKGKSVGISVYIASGAIHPNGFR